MMLLNRFNILNDIHKLRMVVVLVLCNRRIIDRLRRTIGTKFHSTHTADIAGISGTSDITDIAHMKVIITVQSNYLLPVLEYTLLYSHRDKSTCTLDPGGDSPLGFRGIEA